MGSNFQQHLICINDILKYSSQLAHLKYIYIPLSYLSFHFWNKPSCLNSDLDCSGRSTQVHNGDYWWQKIDNSHELEKLAYLTLSSNQLFMPNKILILFRFWQLQKFPNLKRSYLKTNYGTWVLLPQQSSFVLKMWVVDFFQPFVSLSYFE